jgi:predicted nucleic acid-binding Zn ribbon protein
MYCEKCGNELNANEKNCSKCGASVKKNKKKQLTWWQIILTIVVIVGIAMAIGNGILESADTTSDTDVKSIKERYNL